MEYPIFDVPLLGGSLLIAAVAVFHVFIAHFSVGSAVLLAVAERRALGRGDTAMLELLRRFSFLVLLVPYVLGTVTGVGIWFVIALVHPRAVSVLIHQFVWDWAIEWVLFLIEGVAIFLYCFRWRSMDARAHNRIAWIFAACSVGTLVVINAILSFMLTPGAWRPGAAGVLNYRAILNPSYVPTTLARLLIALALAGAGAVLLVSLDRRSPKPARRRLVALAYKLMVPAVLCLPLGAWTFAVMSERAQVFLTGGAPAMVLFLGFGSAGLVLLVFSAVVALIRGDYRASVAGGALMCLLAFVAFGAMEFVREGVRKPYIIEGFMYSTGVTHPDFAAVDPRANLTRTRVDGVLSAAPWAIPPGKRVEELTELQRGRAVYQAACLRCHSVDGYNAIRPLIRGWSAQTLGRTLDKLDEFKPPMPPFPGTESEKRALLQYLQSLNPPGDGAGFKPANPNDEG